LKAEARKLKANIRKYQAFIKEEPDEALCRSHNARAKELQAGLNEVQEKIREAERRNRKPPKPLKLGRGKLYLPDLRELLNQDIPVAAEAIRTLTGPIKIRQEKVPGKPGARWFATFSPDLIALLRQTAREKCYPDAPSLAAISADGQTVEVVIEKIPAYERLAPVFKELQKDGASIQSIAAAHGKCWQYVKDVLHFADTGERPKWKKGKKTGKGAKPDKYTKIAREVAYLRDKKKMSFKRIAAKLGVAGSTVRRAYDHAHREDIRAAVERGDTPRRGRYSHLGEDKYRKIREMLREGKTPAEVAVTVRCSAGTVSRERRRMLAAGELGEAT